MLNYLKENKSKYNFYKETKLIKLLQFTAGKDKMKKW